MENKQEKAKVRPDGNNQISSGIVEEDNGFQCIKYFFTYHFDIEKEDIKQVFSNLEYLKEFCKKWIWAEEYGEKGETPHVQGCFVLKKKMYASTLQKYFQGPAHLVRLKSWDKGFEYCKKEQNLIDTSEKFVVLNKCKCDREMSPWQKKLFLELEQPPDARKIYWRWSEKGETGKTDFARYLHRKLGFIVLSGSAKDMKNGIIEYVKKEGICPVGIVIDIPRSLDGQWFSYTGVEEVKNMFFYSAKYEGGMIDGNPPHLVIFSNDLPENCKLSSDRWDIACVDVDKDGDFYDFLDEL